MKTRSLHLTVLIFNIIILVFLPAAEALGEKWVTVATIGNVPPPFSSNDKQEMVSHVTRFWETEFAKVLPDKPDLIVLPEFCDFSDEGEEYLMARKNQVLDYFSSVAKKNRCYIAFGMQRDAGKGVWRNSCVVLDRDGKIAGIYDKNFPTIGEMEKGIKASNEARLIECDFGRIAVAICFDLNFDELRLKYASQKPDLILFSSMYHGGIAQGIWAYTCRSHFAGSVYRALPSEIRNPMGDVIASTTNYFDFAVARINLDCELVHLDFNWEKITALKEKYGTSVTISDPGKLASVLITSNDSQVTADQMIDEFGIERLDDYLNRARNVRSGQIK